MSKNKWETEKWMRGEVSEREMKKSRAEEEGKPENNVNLIEYQVSQ